ncbi:hypothetical protein AUEXF2481DRAFT_38656 [Aureobasidium subglaciale EXF-2481]|uniref:Uncharacterized protein n=1 Tax=Aureobasidium subglaciale (strain EXF-2481) TaxID=1043005 RepID=A0A074ZCG4_AURSE|nr:uncharacterized protein AUEXF2481DRAFT_38656 [Aureobasidium subglaciale EXF-2481]KEQ96391.1 hypothetical protein AUEXF2481DRAFT_38656 [Aureobasidium subglaciale EXF-2481]
MKPALAGGLLMTAPETIISVQSTIPHPDSVSLRRYCYNPLIRLNGTRFFDIPRVKACCKLWSRETPWLSCGCVFPRPEEVSGHGSLVV